MEERQESEIIINLKSTVVLLSWHKVQCGQSCTDSICKQGNTVKILKIGTPEIITIIVLQLEQLDLTVQYCV